MKLIILLLILLGSCGVSSQKPRIAKVEKDTIIFNFDSSYLSLIQNSNKTYTSVESINYTERVEYSFKKTVPSLGSSKVLNLKNFSQTVYSFKTKGKAKSNQAKLFERLNDNVVIFVDTSEENPKYMEMAIFFSIID